MRVAINGGRVTPHTLRRTFATAVYRERGLMTAKDLLGHTFVGTTQVYVDTGQREAAAGPFVIS